MRRVILPLFVFSFCSIEMRSSQTTPAPDPNPIIQAPVGRIKGSLLQTRLGKPIFSFRAIRYAEPPVGQNRFKEPIPAASWSNVLDATEEGPSCPQPGGISMSEDCLRLNVYTTALPRGRRIRRPVIVFFHPGGFYSFSGQSSVFGPQYLLDKDVVLVTLNYRLASLGFISTGDELAPGNLGLKDQVVALKWVQRNIAAFGGDPRSVTIAGDSAGAWSVILHMLSPLSKGLFHRGIAMSGAPTTHSLVPHDQKDLAIKQAQLLNCNDTSSTQAILDCLRTKSIEDFVSTRSGFNEWYGDPILVWRPVIEPESLGKKRFLTGQPIDLIRQKKINEVPLICGVTKDEFGGVLTRRIESLEQNSPTAGQGIDEDWERIAPISFLYERNTSRSREITRALRRFYVNDQPLSLNNIQGLANLYSDAHITFSTHRMARLMAENSREPVYFYEFTYQGRYSFFTYRNGTAYGVGHHDDLQYLFYMSRFPYFEEGAPEIQMVEKLTKIWNTFVTRDRPTRRNEPVQWKKYDPREDNYLEINTQLAMKKGLFPERMQFWDNLFPLPPSPQRQ